MSVTVVDSPIIRKVMLREGLCDLTLHCPEIARQAQPGQFVMIRCGGLTLRRPISICDANGDQLRIVFEVRGKGTRWLAERAEGETLDLLGPQGRGFDLGDTTRDVVFVGGGIGIFPLLHACRSFGAHSTVLLGFRTASLVSMEADFHATGAEVRLATDDGSAGHHGVVTELLRARFATPCAAVFACGPKPMLKAVAKEALAREIPCQVSLEERMACGVGACLGCATKIRRPDGTDTYAHVCTDGPVFDAQVVVWE